jgi:hypothetical protein
MNDGCANQQWPAGLLLPLFCIQNGVTTLPTQGTGAAKRTVSVAEHHMLRAEVLKEVMYPKPPVPVDVPDAVYAPTPVTRCCGDGESVRTSGFNSALTKN